LWTNHATPFLRWNSGDVIQMFSQSAGSGPWADLFPIIKHAHRTTGFFKIRGVNVNHSEFEDLMFKQKLVNDFQAVLLTDPATGREDIKILIEISRDLDHSEICTIVAGHVKKTFEVMPLVEVLPLGTLAAEFERSIKAPRFVDRRV
jgi:phenylacetate-CoA ligase